VFHFHGPWAAEGRAERNSLPAWLAKRCIEQILYQRPASFVVLSCAFRDVLIRTYRVPADRIFVVPGGVDITRFRSDLDKTASRRALGLTTDRPIVLTIRRLVRRMGLENLITGIAEVARKIPDILLIIGGSGPLQSELEQRIKEQDLTKRIKLLGNVPDADLSLLYRAADISIVPSLSLEGFGLTALEALACGTPVLVTPVGGLPEVVADLSPSLVLSGCEPGILAEGLIAFFSGTLNVPDAGACADYVRQRFDWPIIARQLAGIYTTILADGHEDAKQHENLRAREIAT
jgi:glycosyltransferase involved in cell wall biosynthesis